MKEKHLIELKIDDVNNYPYIDNIFDDEDQKEKEIKVYKKNKKIVPFTYLTKKQFNEIITDEDCEAQVIGNVRLHNKFKRKDNEDITKKKREKNSKIIGCLQFDYSDKYLEKHPKLMYNNGDSSFFELNLYKPKETSCLGYAYVGNNKFVRIEDQKFFILFFIIFCIIASVIIGLSFSNKKDSEKKPIEVEKNYVSDKKFDDSYYENSIQFDFVNHYTINEKNQYMPLYNSQYNRYSYYVQVYLVKPSDINKKDYFTSTKDSNGKEVLYFDTNRNGKKDSDESVVDTMIYSSKLIQPGTQAGVNLYNVLPKGKYYLAFNYQITNKDGSEIQKSNSKKTQQVTNGYSAITTTVDIDK